MIPSRRVGNGRPAPEKGRIMRPNRWYLATLLLTLGLVGVARADGPRAGASAVAFEADDSLVIGGGILPYKAKGQEGELRASAVVVEDSKGAKVCLVACDVLMIARDVLDRAAHRIEMETSIP